MIDFIYSKQSRVRKKLYFAGFSPQCFVMLSQQQLRCLELLESKENCFFLLVKWGRGKLYLLRKAFQQACERNGFDKVFKTAPTGRAAKNIGGTTLHSLAGIGIESCSCYELLSKVSSNDEAVRRW